MQTRINFTDRRKILAEHAVFRIQTAPDGAISFETKLQLESYAFPHDAKVYVEAYRETTLTRYPHGTASHPILAASARSMSLVEFETPDGVRFRVKVVSPDDGSGLLLGEADGIRACNNMECPQDRDPLLPTISADLGHEIWRISFEGTEGPLLQINGQLHNWKHTGASAVFRALVYPSAMREILSRILLIDGEDDPGEGTWQANWLTFARSLPGVGALPSLEENEDEVGRWITGAIEVFTRRHNMLEIFKSTEKMEVIP